MSGELVHDAAVQAVARVGGELGAAIAAHLWAVERFWPALAESPAVRILNDDVLGADRLARAVLALDRPALPDRERLVRAASAAAFDHAPADRALRPSEIVALAVDAVLAALATQAADPEPGDALATEQRSAVNQSGWPVTGR